MRPEHDAECDETVVAEVEPVSSSVTASEHAAAAKETVMDQTATSWSPEVFTDHFVTAVHEVFKASSGLTNREWTRNVLKATTLASQRTAQQIAHPSNRPVSLTARYHGATNLMKEVKATTPELSQLKIEGRSHVPALDLAITDQSGRRHIIAEPEQGGARDRANDDMKLVSIDEGEIAISVYRPTSDTDAKSAEKAARGRLEKRHSPSVAVGIQIPKGGKMSDYKIVGLDRINFTSVKTSDL